MKKRRFDILDLNDDQMQETLPWVLVGASDEDLQFMMDVVDYIVVNADSFSNCLQLLNTDDDGMRTYLATVPWEGSTYFKKIMWKVNTDGYSSHRLDYSKRDMLVLVHMITQAAR